MFVPFHKIYGVLAGIVNSVYSNKCIKENYGAHLTQNNMTTFTLTQIRTHVIVFRYNMYTFLLFQSVFN